MVIKCNLICLLNSPLPYNITFGQWCLWEIIILLTTMVKIDNISVLMEIVFWTFLFIYDSYTGDFIVSFSYIHLLYTTLVHPLHYSPPFSTPLHKMTSAGSNIPYSYIYRMYFNLIHPPLCSEFYFKRWDRKSLSRNMSQIFKNKIILD